jgi:hypothetical protein
VTAAARLIRPLRKLLPHSESHCLLGRDLSLPLVGFAAPGTTASAVTAHEQQETQSLDQFATRHGFPSGWTSDMLSDGAAAILIRETTSGEPIAMGWTTSMPFHIEEIGATLDPAGGIYLFGDFVAPTHRGRKLQRMLVAVRLARASGLSHACTVIHPANVASMRSYQTQGFEITAHFARRQWLGKTWYKCQNRSSSSPIRFTMNETSELTRSLRASRFSG